MLKCIMIKIAEHRLMHIARDTYNALLVARALFSFCFCCTVVL